MEFLLPSFIPLPDDLIIGHTGIASFLPFPPFRIRAKERATHIYVLGVSGQGKSKLLEHLLVQDILAGRGVGLIDPHSDLATDLLANLAARHFFDRPENSRRVIYFDPTRRDYLIPFNVLVSDYTPEQTAANLVEAFRRTWPESLREAPRFSNFFEAALICLIYNRKSLADLQPFLTDKGFREELLQTVANVEAVAAIRRIDALGREAPMVLESILNKVSSFLLNPELKRILTHQDNRLNFARIMDSGGVFIADLGRCDHKTQRLLGSLITVGIEQAALSRQSDERRSRRPFYFTIDEFGDYCASSDGSAMTFAHILSESRKFGLSMTLAHQTLGQMQSERIRSALGNIGVKIIFAVDREDAEEMAKKLFQIDGERIKHEVENEYQQEKSHPVFYTLPEEWEKATQAIQNLKPRTALVKRPRKGAALISTIPIAKHPLSAEKLERYRQIILSKEERMGEINENEGERERLAIEATPARVTKPAWFEGGSGQRIRLRVSFPSA